MKKNESGFSMILKRVSRALLLSLGFSLCFKVSIYACEESTQVLAIQEAEELAITNNKRLQQSFLAKERDYEAFWEQLSFYLPQASFTKRWGHSGSRPEDSVFMGKYVNFNTHTIRLDQLVLSLPLYYEIKSAKWVEIASTFQYLEEFVQTLANIRIAHYRLLSNRNQLVVQQEILDLLKESYENEKIKLDVGESTNYDYKRNLLAYNNALALYYRVAADVEFAKSEWLRVLGIPPEEGLCYDIAEEEIHFEEIDFIKEVWGRIAHEPSQITKNLFSCAEINYWNQIANNYRPLIKKALADYDSSRELVKSARGSYAPEISVFAFRTRNSPAAYFSTRREFTEVGVSLNWQIFDGFGRQSRVARSRKESEIARSIADETRYSVELEVRDRREALQNSLYSVRSSEEAQRLSEQALAMAKELMELGDLTAFEYRDMVQSLGRAKIEAVQSQFNLISSYYSLLASLGLQSEDAGTHLLKVGDQCE